MKTVKAKVQFNFLPSVYFVYPNKAIRKVKRLFENI